MKKLEFESSLKDLCFGEFIDSNGDTVVLYIQFNDDSMEIGTLCNSGMMRDLSVPYDDDFSIDENLQNVFDSLMEHGYSTVG